MRLPEPQKGLDLCSFTNFRLSCVGFFCGAKAGKRVGERERMRAAKWSKCFFGWAELNIDSQTRTRGKEFSRSFADARRGGATEATQEREEDGKRKRKRRGMKEGRAQNSGRRGGRRKKRKWWSLSLEERTEGRSGGRRRRASKCQMESTNRTSRSRCGKGNVGTAWRAGVLGKIRQATGQPAG
jgi:hypothetical protein